MASTPPNILLIMTDEERYPPPYEDDAIGAFRRDHLPARERLRAHGVELHRHYVGSTACLPSRATLFTGQFPSLHGVTDTDGMAKSASDPAMNWLDPDAVPTMGDWFRAAGYRTHYRGKWHISHPDLLVPGTHDALMANDRHGTVRPEVVELYRRANRLDPFGFSGWIGREPHGPDPADTGIVRDPIFADQICDLFTDLGAADRRGDGAPWLAVASFVNPHDIAFSGFGWQVLGFPPPDETVPSIPAAPSQDDSLDDRPTCQRQFRDAWPGMLYAQPTDIEYRRFYYWLHELVDEAIQRVLEALDASPFADNTIVVFTSDHGDLLGAHGGLQQKWHNAYDEAIHVPLVISGAGIEPSADGLAIPTSHVDLLPTLLGLVGVDAASIQTSVGRGHHETHDLPGRDLSALLTGSPAASAVDAFDAPVYFMTEDQISSGLRTHNRFTGDAFDAVTQPANVESIIATFPTGPSGSAELWKLNHYYDRLPEWESATGNGGHAFRGPPVESQWEVHNLTADPEERSNLAAAGGPTVEQLMRSLEVVRAKQRIVPTHRNP